jgi:hypothetical protein
MEGFVSDTSSGLPDERETPFVDPWSKKPNHQGRVPVNALFIGAWDNDLGIDSYSEALFLTRDDRQDLLWSLATRSENSTKQNLAARADGDPEWAKSKIACGCVAGAPRAGTKNKAAMHLDALLRAKVHYEFPGPPFLPGLLTIDELAEIVGAVTEELKHSALAAEEGQRGDSAAPIIKLARELGLNPRPAGHNRSAWMADCPRRSHTIMISPVSNGFGCGYCHRKGGPAELEAFADHIKSLWRKL